MVAPEIALRQLVERFRQAYESLSVEAVGAVYPTVPIAVRRSFENARSIRLEMELLSGPEVSSSTAGRTATASYRIVQTLEPKAGRAQEIRQRATFRFAGIGDAWIIVGIDYERE